MVSISTTLATNAIVEKHGAPICLILMGYDAKALERAGLRQAMGGDPVVMVAGGHKPTGEPQAELDVAAVRAAILEHAPKVAAFAVSGYFSVRNPAHEIAVRALVRELTGEPVTCGHELTSKLDAPRRALTAALNARLIPQLQQLVQAVEGLLARKGIKAPLMVVKGDGSLIKSDLALTCPVETILSGPAASLVGARHLARRGRHPGLRHGRHHHRHRDAARRPAGAEQGRRDRRRLEDHGRSGRRPHLRPRWRQRSADRRSSRLHGRAAPRRSAQPAGDAISVGAECAAGAGRERGAGALSRAVRAAPASARCRPRQPQRGPARAVGQAGAGPGGAGRPAVTARRCSGISAGWSIAAWSRSAA